MVILDLWFIKINFFNVEKQVRCILLAVNDFVI